MITIQLIQARYSLKLVLSSIAVLLGSSFLSNTSFAQSSDWHAITTSLGSANNTQEFVLLQQKYPKAFAGFDSQLVQAASISTTQYLFEGTTLCLPGDAKLLQETYSYSICQQSPSADTGQKTTCEQVASSLPLEADPCGK